MQTTVNGITMTYTDEGKGSPALVFIHGFPLSRATWSKQVDAFRSTHRVIAPDLRGLGQTEAQPGTNTMERYAEDVNALALLVQPQEDPGKRFGDEGRHADDGGAGGHAVALAEQRAGQVAHGQRLDDSQRLEDARQLFRRA